MSKILYESSLIIEPLRLDDDLVCGNWLDEKTGLPTVKYLQISEKNSQAFGLELSSILHSIRCRKGNKKIKVSYKVEEID